MAVVAIDLGTTGCKAGLFEGGEILGLACRHHSYASPREGWAEQDAEGAWTLVKAVVREAISRARPRPTVDAVCVSVQGDAIIPIDRAGRALHPAILGMDTRSYREAEDLERRFGRSNLYAWTGMPCEPLNAVTKIFWLERHRPWLRRDLWKYAHYGEFLTTKLCGRSAVDHSMASRTMAFDPVEKRWIASILDAVGVSPDELGEPFASGAPVGSVSREIADDLGIASDALVVAGGHDQCMAAVGAGVIEPGLACYSMGTAEVIATCFSAPKRTPEMLASNYPCYSHAVPGQYFTITLNQSGGISLEWFQEICGNSAGASDEARSAGYAEAISRLRPSPSPVLFLPHLVGSGTPFCDHRSRGSFLGLSLKTSRADMFQAVVEALAFEARLNLGHLAGQGIEVHELRAVGGGSRSRKILEVKATVLRRPVRTLKCPEAALLGAALLAQVATGRFPSIQAACATCVLLDEAVEPMEAAALAYDDAYGRYAMAAPLLVAFYGIGREVYARYGSTRSTRHAQGPEKPRRTP